MVGLPATTALLLIPLLPLAAGLLGHLLQLAGPAAGRSATSATGRTALAAWLGIGSLLGSAALAAQLVPGLMTGHPVHWEIPWVSLPALEGPQVSLPGFDIPLALDAGLAQILFVLTTALLAAAILGYALRERQADPRAARFYANLTLFAGSMLMLLCADTLLLLYIAWELLGLFSLILIAHPGTEPAKRAARQAFWTTRATDMGLFFAVLLMLWRFNWTTLNSIDLGQALQDALHHSGIHDLQAAGPVMWPIYAWLGSILLLVLLAVLGKSAQWPLSFWLPDAMVAPAPVSALLHAATLVAAGPYLLYALFPLLLPNQIARPSGGALSLAPESMLAGLTLLGALTLVLGGLMAYHAREPKRVLAYSTVSQLGLCVCGFGLLAGHAAYFQLLAHAWSKAALFLAVGILAARWHARQPEAGAADHAPSLDELAGSARTEPLVLAALLLAGGALAGVPLLAGALGKEQILWAAWTRGPATLPNFSGQLGTAFPLLAHYWQFAGVLLVIGLVLTAAYLTRLVGILGWGRPALAAGSAAAEHNLKLQLPEPLQVHDNAGGWGGAGLLTLTLAGVGSLGLSAVYFLLYAPHYHRTSTDWMWLPEGAATVGVTAGAFALALLGAALGWIACVKPRQRPAGAEPGPQRPNAVAEYFANGMYLREYWHAAVAQTGLLLAILAGRAERNVLEVAVQRTGQFGRTLAAIATWFDHSVVDGLRWQASELWWRIRRLHSRYMQTGDLQHYMFVVLIGAVILCVVVIRPLSHIFATVLGRAH